MPSEADPATLAALERLVADAASSLEQLHASIHMRLRGVDWFGARARSARDEWSSEIGPLLSEVAGRLRRLSLAMAHDPDVP